MHTGVMRLWSCLLAAALAMTSTQALAAPSHLTAPTIGTDAEVVAVDDVPDNPDQVGWYDLGPDIGIEGNAVFLGHVDWQYKLRTFGKLRDLSVGDPIYVTDADGNDLTYVVQWVKLYETATAPMQTIYQQQQYTLSHTQAVTLISCGGVFDRVAGSYVSRWVARAIRQIGDE